MTARASDSRRITLRGAAFLAFVLLLGAASLTAWDAWQSDGASLFAYLAAFGFVATTALGGLVLVMVAHATGARWFVVLRRVAEAVAVSLPAVLLGFLPLVFGARFLYPWASSLDGVSETAGPSIVHARAWLSPWPFALRGLACIVIWLALSELLRRASLREDRQSDARAELLQKRLSAVGLPLVGVSGTLAAFDWFMSALAGYHSTIFGLYLLVGGFGAAVGVTTLGLSFAVRRAVLPPQVGAAHLHALGRLLLLCVCLWAYLAASQLVIGWSANLPPEAGFYLARYRGPFRSLALLLLFGHFALPFLLLLSRRAKQSLPLVAGLGGLVIAMHAVDVYWLLMPAARREPSLLDLVPFAGLSAGLFCLGALRFGRARPFPARAAQLEQSLAYESP